MNNRDFPGCWTTVAGLRIHYKFLGNGPPIVLIHGGGNDWREWEQNLAFLSRSHQLFAVDMPGFGLSQPPETVVSPTWSVDFLKDFLDNLGITSTHLIGHSMGAMIAIAFAARYPESVRRMVLVDATGLGDFSRRGQLLLSIFRITDHWQGQKRGPRYLIRPMEKLRVLDELPKIKSPALIVWGQKDFYLPVSQARLAQTLIRDSQLHIFPHCGHAPQREQAAEFNNLTLRFLTAENKITRCQ
jgi:pimeloyl-ACP methyl ester carboxylesterase